MTEATLSYYTRPEKRTLILAFEGTLDLATAPRAVELLEQFIAEHGPDVVLDASRLDFIDSKGVGALISGLKAARDAGGMLYLLNPATPVRKILEMCQLRSMFPSPPETLFQPAPGTVETAAPTPEKPRATSRASASRSTGRSSAYRRSS